MSVSLVLTLIGEDRPGLVELLSNTVAAHDGNWLESRMARMAGRFAGILRANVPNARVDELLESLRALESRGIRIVVERSDVEEPAASYRAISLDLVGSDRPGIIREVSRALAARQINVDELHTGCRSAPMSGEVLFTARARLRIPAEIALDELREAIEAIASDLMVDITLVELASDDDRG